MSYRNIFWGVVVGFLWVSGVFAWMNDNPPFGIVLLLLGMVLTPLIFIQPRRSGRAARTFQGVFSTGLFAMALTGLYVLTDGNVAAVVICLVPLAAIAVLALALQSSRPMRRRRAMVVIAYLEQAIRMNLPLPRMLAAAQASESGATAARLGQVRRQLETGASITAALDVGLRELPARSVGLVAAAERTGQLPRTLDKLVREDRARQSRDPVERAFILVYPKVMCIALFMVVSLIMVFVIPKFEQIFKDFGMDLPWATILLIRISRFFVVDFGPVVLLAMLIYSIWAVRDRYWPGREWPLGWMRIFASYRDLSDACGVIADGLGSGLPLDTAIRSASELPVSAPLRRKLYRWAGGIEQGLGSGDAARRAEMPKLVIGLCATADVSAAHEAFRFLARYYATRFSRIVQLARGAVVPMMVFFFGIIVGLVSLALFLPIVSLIDGSSHRFTL